MNGLIVVYLQIGVIIRQFYNGNVSTAPYNRYVMMWPHISVFISLIVTCGVNS